MKLKNMTNKPITVDNICILPDVTVEISDAFANHHAVLLMQELGMLATAEMVQVMEPDPNAKQKPDPENEPHSEKAPDKKPKSSTEK